MGLSIGIVGLPNVGKSTLFNALTKNKAEASNYPFCTIDPNTGIVPVPDERLERIAQTVGGKKTVPAVVEFIDIAGIVAGAHRGEGLGNEFLSHIRNCDAIAEVIRVFEDKNVTHISGQPNPEDDKETIKIELGLADLKTMQKKILTLEKEVKGNPKAKPELNFAKKVGSALEKGLAAREIEVTEEEKAWLESYRLLSAKPHIFVYNTSEESPQKNKIFINAKIEAELSDLSEAEKKEYLEELGIEEPGLNVLVRKAYELLELQSYFTTNENEVRAWAIKKGTVAPKAAGLIHTDFEKGFIKAEIVNWKDLISLGSWSKAREKGKAKIEGRNYIMQEGDVAFFKFSN